MPNEHEQFLNDLDTDQNQGVDILEQSFDTPAQGDDVQGATGTTTTEEDDADLVIKPKNRRERRLMEKLQEERESSIFLAGKLEAREEAKKSLTEEADYLKGIERIYGTDTPESQIATDLLKKAIVGARDEAKQSAIEELRAERQRELQEEKNASRELDGFIEDIEDTYNVELTENQEKSFFTLLQKMSPKDSEGRIVRYADHHSVYEIFQDKLKSRGTDNRAKDLSSRSMTQGGTSKASTLNDDAHARFLKDNGIL